MGKVPKTQDPTIPTMQMDIVCLLNALYNQTSHLNLMTSSSFVGVFLGILHPEPQTDIYTCFLKRSSAPCSRLSFMYELTERPF